MKRQVEDNIFKTYPTKDMYLEYIKNSFNLIRRQLNKICTKDLNRPFSKEYM